MRYLFLGKMPADCPVAEYAGRFAYHQADCDEVGNPDLDTQTNTDFLYGVKDLETLRMKLRKLEGVLIQNGIPEILLRKWVPDRAYKIESLSAEEFKEFRDSRSADVNAA